MKDIDEQIVFHLSRQGWYVGECPIDIDGVKESLKDDGIDPSAVFLANDLVAGKHLGYPNMMGGITLSKSLARVASVMQIKLAALHEYAHIKFGHCRDDLDMRRAACHEREYRCDLWALKQLMGSRKYNKYELEDAIRLFGDVSNEGESDTHPSSNDRYMRLLRYLRRWV